MITDKVVKIKNNKDKIFIIIIIIIIILSLISFLVCYLLAKTIYANKNIFYNDKIITELMNTEKEPLN